MAEIELADHDVTEAEREFWRSLTIVLDHLHKRAINAEGEVLKLRREMTALREHVEFYSLTVPPGNGHGLGQIPATLPRDGRLHSIADEE